MADHTEVRCLGHPPMGGGTRSPAQPGCRRPAAPTRLATGMTPVVAQLAPALDGVRLTIHVLAAAVWVGGQLTVAGLVPVTRRLDPDAPRLVARSFARLSWPAYVVLLGTGVWNVVAVRRGQPHAWQVVLGVKIAVVVLAGLSAWLHGRSRSRAGLAVWGAMAGASSLAALALGVFLAG